MMNWIKKMAGVMMAGLLSGTLNAALTVTPGISGAVVATERLEAEFRDGMIIRLVNRANGEVLTVPATAGADAFQYIPAGLGLLDDDPAGMMATHVQWGCVESNQYRPPMLHDNYHRPTAASVFKCDAMADAVQLIWTGLGNSKGFYPDEHLEIRLSEDSNGALVMESTGVSPAGGVFGVQTPIVQLSGAARVILPQFGGLEFSIDGPDGLMPAGGAPFTEAPLAAVEYGDSALGIWIEDPHFGPYYSFLGRNRGSFFLALEPQNLMPYEAHTAMKAVPLKLDIVTGDWKSALTPFRKWYRELFATELATRDAIDWSNGIHAIIDVVPEEAADRLAEYFTPGSVLCHDWNGRAPDFDTELPDWTPRAGYVAKVAKLHEYGFRTMAYINTYCVNYQSRIFQQENLAEIFLTRKNAIYQYRTDRKEDQVSELLTGTIVNTGTATDPYQGVPPGSILYGDPLSPGWRNFHARQAQMWNETTGTDANYEDTAGCAGDFGNGMIDGLSAGEGSVAQMRLLQQTQPGVPMASEYGPAEIAFGIKWPLNYAQVWGNDSFRRYRIHHQLPVTTFLYGYTAWVPSVAAESDFLKHVVTAVSDAAGGMGVVMGSSFVAPEDSGMAALMTLRTQIFTERRLKPYFQEGRYPAHIRCMYQGIDGIYSYYDDGHLQQMLDPDGKPLYGRLDGVAAYEVPGLKLSGWPCRNGDRLEGLDPARSYALFPAVPSASACQIIMQSPGLRLASYFETPEAIYAEISSDTSIRGDIQITPAPERVKVNGAFKNGGDIEAALPIRLVIFKATSAESEIPVLSVGATGVIEGSSMPLRQMNTLNATNGDQLYFVNYFQSKSIHRVMQPLPGSAVRFTHRNTSDRYGNGSIVRVKFDGVTQYEFDCAPQAGEYDTREHQVTLPIPAHVSAPVLVSVEVDHKADSNADAQYIGIPQLIQAE